ncbi:unnamed protein product, partial [Mesorhabditis belari]|uniref:Major facilitator superfamily (MFS) profile domain-containing protein n=1 Tax=Mesorhabditis belari TaxID=2138241 RepID=A0AAF3J7T0_9BILA
METTDPILVHLSPQIRGPIVLAAGILCMLSYGVVYTFGNLLPYLVSYIRWQIDPKKTAGEMIWLQTIMNGIPFAMIVGGILERKLGGRAAALIGSLLYTLGCFASYWTVKMSYGWLLVSFGVVMSFGQGIAYNAVLCTAQRWLPNNVGLAGGLIVGGFGCGAFILAPLQTTFINPLNYSVNKDGYFTQEDLLERVPSVFLVMGLLFAVFQTIGLTLLGEPVENPSIEDEPLLVTPPTESSLQEMLCSTTFLMLFLTLTFNAIWVQVTSGLYKAFGQQFISSDIFLSLIGSFSSIFNCASRVFWGLMADNSSYQSSMAIVCTLGAVLMWLLPFVKSIGDQWLFMATICLMFGCVGGTYSLLPFATHRCFGRAHFGLLYGAIQSSITLAGVITALLSQFILPILGYEYLFLICGGFMAISLVLTTLIHFTPYALIREIEEIVVSRRQSHFSHSS